MTSKNNFRAIPFIFSESGHLVTRGNINEHDALFIVDTGASHTCIDLQGAEKKGLSIASSDEFAGGLGGINIERHDTIIDRLYVGEVLLEVLPVAVLDLSHINRAIEQLGCLPIDGVIGNDILKQYNAIIDYGNQQLMLVG